MIKWGIIGLGNMGQKFANSIKETDNAKLIAVSSLNIDKLKFFKNNFQIENNFVFNDYNDLIKCNEIDAVYIATVPHGITVSRTPLDIAARNNPNEDSRINTTTASTTTP